MQREAKVTSALRQILAKRGLDSRFIVNANIKAMMSKSKSRRSKKDTRLKYLPKFALRKCASFILKLKSTRNNSSSPTIPKHQENTISLPNPNYSLVNF